MPRNVVSFNALKLGADNPNTVPINVPIGVPMTSADSAGQWIGATKAARLLGVTPRALSKARNNGRLPPHVVNRISERRIEYLWPALKTAWNDSRDVGETIKLQAAAAGRGDDDLFDDGADTIAGDDLAALDAVEPAAPRQPSQAELDVAEVRQLKLRREKLALAKAEEEFRQQARELIPVEELEDAMTRLAETLIQGLVMMPRKSEETAALKTGDKPAHRKVWEAAVNDYRKQVAKTMGDLARDLGVADVRESAASDGDGAGGDVRPAG